jgi:hypothetical protein
MRRIAFALTAALAATSALAHDDFISRRSSAEECSERNIRMGDGRTYVKKEVISAGALRSIRASVTNAPVTVEGGSSAGYQITVCKAAESLADLEAIHVRLDGDELKADGPDNSRWTAMYHILTPRGADVHLEAKNGPLSLDNVEGNVEAITRNGPVSIHGGSGTMKVQAANGPLSVKLDGLSWNGTLDASTRNGPLSVRVPRGFTGGVLVESKGHGPVSCRAEGCDRAWRSDDDGEPRRIELGTGTANVRLSTVNGPVTVKDE